MNLAISGKKFGPVLELYARILRAFLSHMNQRQHMIMALVSDGASYLPS